MNSFENISLQITSHLAVLLTVVKRPIEKPSLIAGGSSGNGGRFGGNGGRKGGQLLRSELTFAYLGKLQCEVDGHFCWGMDCVTYRLM